MHIIDASLWWLTEVKALVYRYSIETQIVSLVTTATTLLAAKNATQFGALSGAVFEVNQ